MGSINGIHFGIWYYGIFWDTMGSSIIWDNRIRWKESTLSSSASQQFLPCPWPQLRRLSCDRLHKWHSSETMTWSARSLEDERCSTKVAYNLHPQPSTTIHNHPQLTSCLTRALRAIVSQLPTVSTAPGGVLGSQAHPTQHKNHPPLRPPHRLGASAPCGEVTSAAFQGWVLDGVGPFSRSHLISLSVGLRAVLQSDHQIIQMNI